MVFSFKQLHQLGHCDINKTGDQLITNKINELQILFKCVR